MSRYLNWEFPGNDESRRLGLQGYAQMSREMTAALRSIGVELDVLAETVVINSIPWRHFTAHERQRKGIFSMWEFTELPFDIRAGLAPFDFALVPSHFSKGLFAEHVDGPVHVVPLGVDPSKFFPQTPRKDFRDSFIVVSAATNLRKGATELVEAFKRADIPDGYLVLKGPKRYVQESERVRVIDAYLPDVRSFYWNADLYVSMSRGEGWDLIAFEALACGVPTIVPRHTAYLDWWALAQGALTKWRMEPAEVAGLDGVGEWCVMDVDEAAEYIRYAYEQREQLREDARASAKIIAETYTWENSAHKLVELLSPLRPLTTDSPKVDLEPNLVPAVGVKYLERYDVGGFEGTIMPNASYRLRPTVARVLQDAGYVQVVEGGG